MDTAGPSPRRWMRTWLLALGCFAAVLGAKLDFIDRAATDLPNWDQWDAESERLLVPWLRGELKTRDLFIPHNEHRIVPTKLLALALFEANGQWDARLECVANAVLQSLLALAVFLGGLTLIDDRWRLPWLLGVFAFFGAPMSWQNATGGFHTQQTFLIGFGLATVLLLAEARPGQARWWAGLACALASLVTMGSGLLAAVAAGATLVAITPLRDLARRHGLTLVLLAAIAVLGWVTRVEVSYHATLKAQSPAAFLLSFWRSLQWPVVGVAPFPLLAWAPFTWLAWRIWASRREGVAPGQAVLFGTGIWVLLQFAASAYARGGTGDWPAVRYLDTVAIGLTVNLLALLIAVSRLRPSGWRRIARTAAATTGIALLAHGWWRHIDDTMRSTVPILAREAVEKQNRTRLYLRTGDIGHLSEGVIPYPGAEALAQRLAPPEIRAALPACVRTPLPLEAADTAVSPFAPGAIAPENRPPPGWPVIGSYAQAGDAATGLWRSRPLPVTPARFWQIPLYCSHPGSADLSVHLIDEAGGELAILLPDTQSGWHTVTVPAPRVPARLVARDSMPEGWLAFGAPAEMAAGSHAAAVLARSGLPLGLTGFGLALIPLCRVPSWSQRARAAWQRERELWRSLPRLRLGLTAAVGAAIAGAAAAPVLLTLPPAYFDARVSGDLDKRSMELFFNRGRGIRGEDSVQVWFDAEETARHLHLPITGGTIRALRIDPMDHGATLTIEDARIVDNNGATLRELPPSAFRARAQIARLEAIGDRLIVTSESGALDSQLDVPLDPPLSTRPRSWHGPLRLCILIACATAGGLLAPSACERARRAFARLAARSPRPQPHP